jgi:hypothetical protein
MFDQDLYRAFDDKNRQNITSENELYINIGANLYQEYRRNRENHKYILFFEGRFEINKNFKISSSEKRFFVVLVDNSNDYDDFKYPWLLREKKSAREIQEFQIFYHKPFRFAIKGRGNGNPTADELQKLNEIINRIIQNLR